MGKLKDSELIQQSTSAEHYTPPQYIEAARLVLGSIDLDPASCKAANKTVKATEFFDKKKNGLEREWHGKVFLNPPYGDLVGKFIAKLMAEMEASRTTEAIVLVNAHCTDTAWFQPLWDGCLCFTDHRINFTGDKDRSGSTHGSIFVYFGPNKALFEENFLQFGTIIPETRQLYGFKTQAEALFVRKIAELARDKGISLRRGVQGGLIFIDHGVRMRRTALTSLLQPYYGASATEPKLELAGGGMDDNI
jgi:DNA N-6-adenine-methyltransferase (Dam)